MCNFLYNHRQKYPHSTATPTAHPWRVGTRNEICLKASEILLRKMKSVCDGRNLHCVQVVDLRYVNKQCSTIMFSIEPQYFRRTPSHL